MIFIPLVATIHTKKRILISEHMLKNIYTEIKRIKGQAIVLNALNEFHLTISSNLVQKKETNFVY